MPHSEHENGGGEKGATLRVELAQDGEQDDEEHDYGHLATSDALR